MLASNIRVYRTRVEIQNGDGSLMAFISTALPDHLRQHLDAFLVSCLETVETLNFTDSWSNDQDSHFSALHFSWYNHHCTQGDPFFESCV
jgi:hypothetical protein